MGKTTAEQECAHVVKHGVRLLLLGIPPKLILISGQTWSACGSQPHGKPHLHHERHTGAAWTLVVLFRCWNKNVCGKSIMYMYLNNYDI